MILHLAIDNSDQCSLALACDGSVRTVAQPSFGRDCDSRFLPYLKDFLAESGHTVQDVTHWSLGTGPGSFAGIRFILAMIKGITTVTHAKSRGIPASYALCRAGNRQGRIAILQDARCGKGFYSSYQSRQDVHCRADNVPCLIDLTPAAIAALPCDAILTPSRELFDDFPEDIRGKAALLPPPEARFLLDAPEELYPWLDTPEVEPLYVRPPA